MPGVKGRSGGKRIGAGRIAFCPTDVQRKLVQSVAGFGLRAEDIAQLVYDKKGKPISVDTLARYCFKARFGYQWHRALPIKKCVKP